MLSPSLDTVRVFLHVFAAAVWVGGQLVLAQLIPGLRRFDGAPKAAARRFGMIAWPAFVVLVLTGMWSLARVDVTTTTLAYQITVFVKILLAIAAGAAAAAHSLSARRSIIAAGGAIGLVCSLGAVFLGVMLQTGG